MNNLLDNFSDRLIAFLAHPLFGDMTVGHVLTLLVLCGIVIISERLVRRQIIMRLLGRTRMEPAVQFAVGRIAGYGYMALGIYISFQVVGINVSSLAILAGAVGVGLGFGLQNIISNFVSGLIILAERPIAIGDRVEIQGLEGHVKEISLRSTTILTNDNITIIVPNANFISANVTNLSHGDPRVRFRIPFGVAYGTNLDRLKRLMLQVADEHPKALKNPPPDLFFTGFGDSSLNFELVVWTEEMTFMPRRFRSDLYFAIESKLRENGIEIPFPQRDLRIRSAESVPLAFPR